MAKTNADRVDLLSGVSRERVKTKKTAEKLILITATLFLIVGFLFMLIGAYLNSSKCRHEGSTRIFNDKHSLPSKVRTKSPSRQNRALRLMTDQVCSSIDCFANSKLNEKDVQNKIDEIVGNLLINGHFEWSTTLAKAQMAFLKCYQNQNSTLSQKTFIDLYHKLMDIADFVDYLVSNEKNVRQGVTQIVLKFWHSLGVEVLFNLKTAKTFTNVEKEREALVYMNQKLLPEFNQRLVDLAKRGEVLTGRVSGQSSDLVQFLTYSVNSDVFATLYSASPLRWMRLSVDEANERWSHFNFSLYFRDLDYPRNNYGDEEFVFAITSPDYMNQLNARFNELGTSVYYLLFDLGVYTALSEFEPHLVLKSFENEWLKEMSNVEKIQRCAAELRNQLPLAVSRVFVDSLDEEDLELRINKNLTVYEILTSVWTQTDDFVEQNLNISDIELLNNYLLPSRFFTSDHGYIADEKQFDFAHRRLKLNEKQNMMETLIEMRKFKRLRAILCLSLPNKYKCDSYYSEVSSAIAKISYLEQENTVNMPVGLMVLMQEIYDQSEHDHHSKFENMISTVRCLIRQVFRDKRMKKSVLLWDENGRLFQEKQLKEIQSLPKVFKCEAQ